MRDNIGRFIKGELGYWKGKHLSEKHKRKIRERMKGKYTENKSPSWKGGRYKNDKGYFLVLKPNHPFCNNKGYIYEHRLIIEQQIGRYLKPEEICHHRGIKYPTGSIKNRQDNRPENLMAFISQSAHMRFHYNFKNIEQEEIVFNGGE